MNKLYPLTFKPILKEIIWGGQAIAPFKSIQSTSDKIGESWEISEVEGNVSVVANGPLEGKDLSSLIKEYQDRLIGKKNLERFGNKFPLLIKFIDARDNLSIQVHPNDELAKKRHNSFGKTEMWYVVKAEKDARLISGFSKSIDAEEYEKRVTDNTLTDVLQSYNVEPGNVFFLPAGRVHAIGAGCFIAEIQQTSNITYRIYDYNRKDKQGNTRELHTELAKAAIDYTLYDDYRTYYKEEKNTPSLLVSCDYFTTNLINADQTIDLNFKNRDSFTILIGLEGDATVNDSQGNSYTLRQGVSMLIPAEMEGLNITPKSKIKLLETYL